MLKNTLLQAVHAAADEMRRFIDLEFKISNKEGVNNLVTEVDHASEKIIIDTIRKNYPVHRLGSAAIDLAWVAAGRFDGFYEHKLQAWDSAAGFLMVSEAGGMVTHFNGEEYSPYEHGLIASNGIIHDELIRWVKGDLPK